MRAQGCPYSHGKEARFIIGQPSYDALVKEGPFVSGKLHCQLQTGEAALDYANTTGYVRQVSPLPKGLSRTAPRVIHRERDVLMNAL